jgi:probable F420-dependent oxidoreductase
MAEATATESSSDLRWSIALPGPQLQLDVRPDQLIEAACAVEDAGFDAVWVSDHPLPYDPATLRHAGWAHDDQQGAGHHTWDPFVMLGWVAMGTQRLMLHTNAVVLPYRNPFITAKSVATLQHLSLGRVILGVAPGWLAGEFAALGVDLGERADLMKEGLEALRAAWTGAPFRLSSPRWQVDGNSALPTPDPSPPLWAAGNSRAALARAARYCDGWAPFEVDETHAALTGTAPIGAGPQLAQRIRSFHALRAEHGRTDPATVCLTRMNWASLVDRSPNQVRDELAGLRADGVTWIAQSLVVDQRDEWLRRLETLYKIVG